MPWLCPYWSERNGFGLFRAIDATFRGLHVARCGFRPGAHVPDSSIGVPVPVITCLQEYITWGPRDNRTESGHDGFQNRVIIFDTLGLGARGPSVGNSDREHSSIGLDLPSRPAWTRSAQLPSGLEPPPPLDLTSAFPFVLGAKSSLRCFTPGSSLLSVSK